ncbi:YopX family protein [Pedobacter agri]|uniref:YopX family protein n=1 Tax=Pedobacter agri TaxID=454586 RepID=UPI0027885280|nr:YopX family protein [Pedobacter agri]MDQ1139441.1 putative phage protein (TIGR01671 family) [Pedobacter agri]
MREIIFRALCSTTKKWVTGYFCKDYSGTAFITSLDGTETQQVDAETLGQYAGLKDKNGVMIFEGDMIHRVVSFSGIKNEFTETIGFTDASFYTFKEDGNADCYLADFLGHTIEVIGNIHVMEATNA